MSDSVPRHLSASSDYGTLDRILHALVLGAPAVQKLIGSIEDEIYESIIGETPIQRSVFVTGLPRAGTTLVLELLFDTREFATFTYRQMPFVLTPLIWDALSSRFRKPAHRRSRSHEDGIEISYDSPESFEEVLWIAYLRRAYLRPDHLLPLGRDALSAEFIETFRRLSQKIVRLASRGTEGPGLRYLSKNNNNLCRIDAIRRVFPDAQIIVPFRNPRAQCRSLLRQHQRFLEIHRSDRFSRDYMRWIGHFEFGANLRPIRFDARQPLAAERYGDCMDSWIRYWCDAYEFFLSTPQDRVHALDYDELSASPQDVLTRLARAIELRDPQKLIGAARRVGPGAPPAPDTPCNPLLAARASEIHTRLRARAL